MNERAKLSRKKTKTSDISDPSLAPKIPKFVVPQNDSNFQLSTPTPENVQREISQEKENQENISLKQDSPLENINYLEKATIFRPQKTVQRKTGLNEEVDINTQNQSKSGNLPAPIQSKMEHAFNANFSDVKVHDNSESAKSLGAIAYTQGNEIHFAPGYNPYTSENQEYLGHELSHVLQQRRGVVKGTHIENGYVVSEDESLESQADEEGRKAVRGESVGNENASLKQGAAPASIQKKSQPIQMWRDVPGQARIESTSPDTQDAWDVFMRAARQCAGGHADSAESELRTRYYTRISQRLRGSFQPINIDLHTTGGFNHHWTGTIRFVFGDTEKPLPGSGTANTTLGTTSGSSGSLESSSSNTTGSSGSAEGGYSQGDEGYSGTTSVGGSGSTTTGIRETQGDSQTSSSSSQVRQQLNRFSSDIGIEVNINASYDMGSSWTDWVNPATYASWAAASIMTESGSATGACGTVIYYKGAGIANTPQH